MPEWYRRYRKWAHDNWTTQSGIAMGAKAGALGAGLISLTLIMGWSWRPILGWLCVVGGPIAAFDAWGAAMYRGRPAEAWTRAGVLVLIFAAGAWFAFAR